MALDLAADNGSRFVAFVEKVSDILRHTVRARHMGEYLHRAAGERRDARVSSRWRRSRHRARFFSIQHQKLLHSSPTPLGSDESDDEGA